MFKWQYRIVHRFENGEHSFAIHEYFPGKGAGSITEEPVSPVASTLDGLLDEYTSMIKEAYARPVLEYEDFNSTKSHESVDSVSKDDQK